MIYQAIEKQKGGWALAPNLLDYDKVCATFSWDSARRELDGLPIPCLPERDKRASGSVIYRDAVNEG